MVSNITKRIAAQQRRQIQAKMGKNLKDIEGFEVQVAARKAANVTLKKDYDALKKDIPDPSNN